MIGVEMIDIEMVEFALAGTKCAPPYDGTAGE